MASYNRYTPEQEAWLREHAHGISRAQLTAEFNERFGTNKSVQTIKSWCNHRGLYNGSTGRFTDGHRSWQTGLRGEEYKRHYTEESWQQARSGLIMAEQKHQEGDVIIRHGLPAIYKGGEAGVGLDDRIEYASTSVWEKANGRLPDDMKLIHLDGDVMNYDISNLRAIPKTWLADLRYTGGLTDNRDLNEAKLKYCALRAALRGETA